MGSSYSTLFVYRGSNIFLSHYGSHSPWTTLSADLRIPCLTRDFQEYTLLQITTLHVFRVFAVKKSIMVGVVDFGTNFAACEMFRDCSETRRKWNDLAKYQTQHTSLQGYYVYLKDVVGGTTKTDKLHRTLLNQPTEQYSNSLTVDIDFFS